MTSSRPGRLINPEPWQRLLPADLFSWLRGWATLRPYDVTHLRWLDTGMSGSYVALVQRHRHECHVQGAIIKLIPPELGEADTAGVAMAWEYSPQRFRDDHLVPTVESTLLGGGWYVHVQKVAQVDVAKVRPLAELTTNAGFGEYCANLAGSVVNQWKRPNDPPAPTRAAGDFLRESLALHLRLEGGGLREFAARAGLDVDNPAATVRLPGRHADLPNPFALIAGRIGAALGDVVIFSGNGHGDLNLHNILVPVAQDIIVEPFLLVDLGRFSPATPVARDPMKLLLSFAQSLLPGLVPESAVRTNLAEVTVAPRAYSAAPNVIGYRHVAERVHAAGEAWAGQRGFVGQWHAHNHVVLIDAALRTAAQTRLGLADRMWYFEVAALATEMLTGAQPRPLHPLDPLHPLAPHRKWTGEQPGSADPARPSAFSGGNMLDFFRRLGPDWRDLAALLDIPEYEQAQWQQGVEAREIWAWLVRRERLPELAPALRRISRGDLATIFDGQPASSKG
jgi:Bacterial Death-like domain 3